ncbi:hypothetical protein D3C79_662200 [compost metagenome]
MLTCTSEASTGSVGARMAAINNATPQGKSSNRCNSRHRPAMVNSMTGPARPKATRHRRRLRARRNLRPLTNSENSSATSVRCSIHGAAATRSSCSSPRPEGPMAMPSTRHTAEVVTGNQRR